MPECHHMNQGWKDEEKACENEEVDGALAEGLYSPGLSFLPRPFLFRDSSFLLKTNHLKLPYGHMSSLSQDRTRADTPKLEVCII